MCTGNTIKTKAGNGANCEVDDPCDGMTTVPNENHTACGIPLLSKKYFNCHYQSLSIMTRMHPTRMPTTRTLLYRDPPGQRPPWTETSMDGEHLPTVNKMTHGCKNFIAGGNNIYFLECNAGYYGSANTTCTQCLGNTVKTSQGDSSDCDTDLVCDGLITVPNVNHSACGMFT